MRPMVRDARPSSSIGRLGSLAIALLFLALGIGVVLRPYATGSAMPGDLGDARFNLTLLEFFYRTLIKNLHGDWTSFVNAPFFYPWPLVTNFSDTFWGNGIVYALARALGCGKEAAFNVWFVAGFVFTYAAAYVVLRKLGLRAWGASAGAFLFAFPLPMAAQFGHAQLVYRLWIPPALLTFRNFSTRRDLRGGSACLFFIALQLATSIYLGMFLVLLIASYGLTLCLFARDRLALPSLNTLRAAGRTEWIAAGILGVAGLVLLAIVAIPYAHVQRLYGFGWSWDRVAQGLPRPQSFLLAGVSRIWPNVSAMFPLPLGWEQQLFPGLSAIIPLAWSAASRRARARHPLALEMLGTVAILFVLTIDIGGISVFRVLYFLPGFSALREVARIILVMMFPMAVLFGLLIDDLIADVDFRYIGRASAVLLSAFLVVECSSIYHLESNPVVWRERVEALKARMPKRMPAHAILAVSTAHANGMAKTAKRVDAIVVATSLGIRTLNGYSGNLPPTWKPLTTCRDIVDDVRAGQRFRAEHGFPRLQIEARNIITLGFGSCDLTGLGREPELVLGHTYHFSSEGDGSAFEGDGFSYPEKWGTWTNAKNAFLLFSLPSAPVGPIAIVMDATALPKENGGEQVIAITANGRSCGAVAVHPGAARTNTICPTGALRAGKNVLRLRVRFVERPIDLRINQDRRHLGVGLKTLRVVAVSGDAPAPNE